MFKVTVTPLPVELIKWTDKNTGEQRSMRKQSAYLHFFFEDGTPSPVPDKFGFVLRDDQQPYAPGDYQLHPSALQVDRDGRLSCKPVLTPLAKR